jgi:hypothetical protein
MMSVIASGGRCMAKAGDLGTKQPKPERARISQMGHRYQPVRCGAIAFMSEARRSAHFRCFDLTRREVRPRAPRPPLPPQKVERGLMATQLGFRGFNQRW